MSRIVDELKSKYDEYTFSGRRGWGSTNTVASSAVVDKGPIGFNGENIVELRIGTYGVYPASETPGTPDWYDQNLPNHVYIYGSENYDGLRRVYNLRSGRYLQIYAPYVAESPSGVTLRCGFQSTVACEFGGFSCVATQLGVMGIWQSGTLDITIHSAKGSAFDNLIFSENLIHRSKVEYMYKTPRFMEPGDRLDFALNGSGQNATKLYIRKLA